MKESAEELVFTLFLVERGQPRISRQKVRSKGVLKKSLRAGDPVQPTFVFLLYPVLSEQLSSTHHKLSLSRQNNGICSIAPLLLNKYSSIYLLKGEKAITGHRCHKDIIAY